MVFRYFPYANFHEINFDWLLQHVRDIDEWVKQFDPDFVKTEIQSVINEMVESGEFDIYFQTWIEPLQSAIDDLTPRVTALETAVETLSDTVSDHTTDISNLTDTVSNNYTELSGYITTLTDTTIPGIQSDISALSHDLTDLSDDYSSFKSNVNEELSNHETRITALENDEPPIPSFFNRNYTYRGQQFDTLSELLSAVESGLTYIGDYWSGVIPHPDPGITLNVTVYVAFHRSNSSAYLIIHPTTLTSERKAVDYSDSDPDSIRSTIDSIVQRNYSTFNSKLSTFNITDSSSSISVWGCLLSACQYFGYPAFNPDGDLGYNINGKLPFVSQYLTSATDIMLMDNSATDYAFINSGYSSIGGMLSYNTSISANMSFPFVVKYN